MARTVLNKLINAANPYTIPAGKYAIFKAYMISGGNNPEGGSGGTVFVTIAGSSAAAMSLSSGGVTATPATAGPLVAASGNIITYAGSYNNGSYAISGFLYDN